MYEIPVSFNRKRIDWSFFDNKQIDAWWFRVSRRVSVESNDDQISKTLLTIENSGSSCLTVLSRTAWLNQSVRLESDFVWNFSQYGRRVTPNILQLLPMLSLVLLTLCVRWRCDITTSSDKLQLTSSSSTSTNFHKSLINYLYLTTCVCLWVSLCVWLCVWVWGCIVTLPVFCYTSHFIQSTFFFLFHSLVFRNILEHFVCLCFYVC